MPVDEALIAPHPPGVLARPQARPAGPPRHAKPAASEPVVWTATGHEPQVFLDRTGRRERRVRFAGGGLALAATTWFAALVTGAIGFSTLPAPHAGGPGFATGAPAISIAASATRHRDRRRVVAVAGLAPKSAAAAHALARHDLAEAGGSIR